ncbi:DUF4384 domain-containing protein [Patescibacteria group bacterium]|nr:DUF4384 domain-containing protein [Patescibacteria group bacterium]
MKKKILAATALALALVIGGLAVSASQSQQVWIGGRVFAGNPLVIGLSVSDDHFYGSVTLPCSGYLYVFYQGDSRSEQYMLFPNSQDRGNYKSAGLNVLPLSMLFPIGKSQKLTVLFSPFKLLLPDFCRSQGPYLSIRDIWQWCIVREDCIWVGERMMPFISATSPPQCSTRPVSPAPTCPVPPTCYQTHPVPAPCCPSPCCATAFWWWLMIGIIIAY